MANQFGGFLSQLGIQNPRRKNTGFNYTPFTVAQGEQTPGQQFQEDVSSRASAGLDLYNRNRSKSTNRVATDIAGKSAFQVPTDEFGLVTQELTDFRSILEKQNKSTSNRGKLALQTEEAKGAWNQAKKMQDLGQYAFTGGVKIDGTVMPGATGDNPGAKAVAKAMEVMKSGTPYVWGGNSLSKGIDCSGLVQQVYGQLGVQVPRTTWQQAKHGKPVEMNSLRPGDLIFYRNLGHVGIYMGGGKFVHAANSKLGVITSSVYGSSNGQPELAIRPY